MCWKRFPESLDQRNIFWTDRYQWVMYAQGHWHSVEQCGTLTKLNQAWSLMILIAMSVSDPMHNLSHGKVQG